MPTLRAMSAVLICAASLAAAEPALGQSPLAVEFQVNAFTSRDQENPDAAMDGAGGFVVVWESDIQADFQNEVFARRFGPGGFPLSSDVPVNTYNSNDHRFPAVAMEMDGDFLVTWEDSGQDGDGAGIFARRFDAVGAALSVEFQVNTRTTDYQSRPDVAMDAEGDFIVVWVGDNNQDGSDTGIFAQRFVGLGTPFFGEFLINQITLFQQTLPSVAMAGDGSFVIAWSSQRVVGGHVDVVARRFSSFGAASDEFQVNVWTAGNQLYPRVALDGDGDFVVVWESFAQDGDGNGTFGRRFNSSGAALGGDFQVNVRTTGDQSPVKVSADGGAGFVAVWTSIGQDGSGSGVFMRRFASNGNALTGDLQISTYTTAAQGLPVIASRPGGDFVVAWTSSQDGDYSGIFGQRFAGAFAIDVDADGAVLPLNDGILLLRFLFGFTGGPLVDGAVNLDGCGRCTAQEIEAFLNGMF